MSLMLAPYNDSMRLGMGFNSYTQTMCIDNAVHFNDGDKVKVENTSQVVTYTSKFVERLSDIVSSMNISYSSAIKKGTIEVSGNGNSIDEDKIKASDINLIVSVQVINQTTIIKDSATFKAMANVRAGSHEFNEAFGDCYISGFIEGGDFSSIVSMRCLDRTKTNSVVRSIKKMAKTNEDSEEFTMDSYAFSDSLSSSSAVKDTETTISVNWMGGGQIKDPGDQWDIDTVYKAAAAFPSCVAKTPQRTWAILTKYKANRSFNEWAISQSLKPLEYDAVISYTAELFNNFMEYKQLIKQVQNIISNPSDYVESPKPNHIPIDIKTLVAVRTALRTEMNKIVAVVNLLSRNPQILAQANSFNVKSKNKLVQSIIDEAISASPESTVLEDVPPAILTPATTAAGSSVPAPSVSAPSVSAPSVSAKSVSDDFQKIEHADAQPPKEIKPPRASVAPPVGAPPGAMPALPGSGPASLDPSGPHPYGAIPPHGATAPTGILPPPGAMPPPGPMSPQGAMPPLGGMGSPGTMPSLGAFATQGAMAAPGMAAGLGGLPGSSGGTAPPGAMPPPPGAMPPPPGAMPPPPGAMPPPPGAMPPRGAMPTPGGIAAPGAMPPPTGGAMPPQSGGMQPPGPMAAPGIAMPPSTGTMMPSQSASEPQASASAAAPAATSEQPSQPEKTKIDLATLIAPEVWAELLPARDPMVLVDMDEEDGAAAAAATMFPPPPPNDAAVGFLSGGLKSNALKILSAVCGVQEITQTIQDKVKADGTLTIAINEIDSLAQSSAYKDMGAAYSKTLAFTYQYGSGDIKICAANYDKSSTESIQVTTTSEHRTVTTRAWSKETWSIMAVVYGGQVYIESDVLQRVEDAIKSERTSTDSERSVTLTTALLGGKDPWPGVDKTGMIFFRSSEGGPIRVTAGLETQKPGCVLTDQPQLITRNKETTKEVVKEVIKEVVKEVPKEVIKEVIKEVEVAGDTETVVVNQIDMTRAASNRISVTFEAGQLNVEASDEPFLKFKDGVEFKFQPDGNFVIYDNGGKCVWACDKYDGTAGTSLRFQYDGNFCTYSTQQCLWYTNTNGPNRRLLLSSAVPWVEIFDEYGTRIFSNDGQNQAAFQGTAEGD